jgi:hypothetical protein
VAGPPDEIRTLEPTTSLYVMGLMMDRHFGTISHRTGLMIMMLRGRLMPMMGQGGYDGAMIECASGPFMRQGCITQFPLMRIRGSSCTEVVHVGVDPSLTFWRVPGIPFKEGHHD